jgi:hypothetical protein
MLSTLKIKYESIWDVKHYRDGVIIWEDSGKNAIVQGGEEAVLETFFRNGTSYAPAEFYIRLCNETLLVTSTLSSVSTEPSGNGYSAQLVERSIVGFPTKETVAGVVRLTSKVLSFTASGGNIGPVTTAYLATTSNNVGTLIAFRALSMTRTVISGDTITLSFRVQLSS